MPEPRSQARAEAWLTFGSALTGLFALFGCHSRPFRISKFVLGFSLRLSGSLCVIPCLIRLFGRLCGFLLRSL